MPLNRIFETQSKSFGTDDVVGYLKSGMQIDGRPVALDSWRITSGDPDVMKVVAESFGGEVETWETTTEHNQQVLTEVGSLDVQLISVQSNFALWGRGNKPIRICDGISQTDENKTPCACPNDTKEHKEAARAGTACSPSIRALVRLKDHPDLGMFRYVSGSWQLAEAIGPVEEAVAASDSPLDASISLVKVEWETKQGQKRAFTKPVIKLADGADGESK
jgi:hypothetical protein